MVSSAGSQSDPFSPSLVTAFGHNFTPVGCGHSVAGRRRGGVFFGTVGGPSLGRGHNLVTVKLAQPLIFCKFLKLKRKMVGDTGIEPVTPAV
jgi:hypothetical protein